MTIPNEIHPSEKLARSVFSGRRAKRAKRGTVPADIFQERAGVTRISVDRLDHAPLAAAVAIAEKNAAAREQKFYGWVVISERKAATSERRVKASPRPDNPYHADIVLPDIVKEDPDERTRHAQELADSSSWRACPPA